MFLFWFVCVKLCHNLSVIMPAGEDRWLCTLMLKQGWRVEYNAASDAYTNAPQEFKEFYNQVIISANQNLFWHTTMFSLALTLIV